jgi:hypothetical protein
MTEQIKTEEKKPYGWACAIRDANLRHKRPSIGATIRHYWGKIFK